MTPVMTASKTIIPLSSFSEHKAADIFDEVRRTGTKLVVNDDDGAECIIMSPEEYMKMSDDYNEIKLIAMAEERLRHLDLSKLIPAEEFYKELGITDEDIDGWEDVELE